MILTISGSVLIIGGASIIGFLLAANYSTRPNELKVLQVLINMLENEIRFLSSFISEAFEKIYKTTDSPVSLFFIKTLDYIKKEDDLNMAKAWEKAVRENIGKTSLKKEDGEILISFGKMLGNSDIEGQIKNIRFTLQQLSLQEQKAEELKKKYETMYKTLGVIGGIAIVILLL